jgi:hypothetical protein
MFQAASLIVGPAVEVEAGLGVAVQEAVKRARAARRVADFICR